jgi:cytochrome c-type biogenesis protein CcmE
MSLTDATPERRRRRLLTVGTLAAAAAVVAFLAFGGIGENLVYYWSPSELLGAGSAARGATVRLGGLVAPGSLVREADGLTLHFAVTDGRRSVPVTARAVPPAMFREGIGVVVEGSLAADGEFQTQRLMVKHDNEYRAPGEGEEPDMEELVKTMRLEAEG